LRILIAAIGRAGRGAESTLIDGYCERIRSSGRAVGITRFEIREIDSPKGLEGDARCRRESTLLADSANPAAKLMVLDERGENFASEDLARQIEKMRDHGAREIAFLIGGADGHHRSLREKADLTLAFGRATFPHMLVRAMLTEQIYRVITILSGHPYHRA